jgi:hypothetical protein
MQTRIEAAAGKYELRTCVAQVLAWGIINDKFELKELASIVIPDVSGYRRLALCCRNRSAIVPSSASGGRMYGALVMRMVTAR